MEHAVKNFIWGSGPRFETQHRFYVQGEKFSMELSSFMCLKNKDEFKK